MTTVTDPAPQPSQPVERTTLLDLVWRVDRTTRDEESTVATITRLLDSGRVELTGNFRDVPVETFLS